MARADPPAGAQPLTAVPTIQLPAPPPQTALLIPRSTLPSPSPLPGRPSQVSRPNPRPALPPNAQPGSTPNTRPRNQSAAALFSAYRQSHPLRSTFAVPSSQIRPDIGLNPWFNAVQIEEQERIKRTEDISLLGRLAAIGIEHETEARRGEGDCFGAAMQRSAEAGLRGTERMGLVVQDLGVSVDLDVGIDPSLLGEDLGIDRTIEAAGEELEQNVNPAAKEASETLQGQRRGVLTGEKIQENIGNLARLIDDGRL